MWAPLCVSVFTRGPVFGHATAVCVFTQCLVFVVDVDDSDVDPQSAPQSKKSGLGTVGRKSQRKVPKRLEVCVLGGPLREGR